MCSSNTFVFQFKRFLNRYPLTAPKVNPWINCRWRIKNIITGGKAATTEPAETRFQLVVHLPLKTSRPTVIGLTESPCVKTRAQK